MRRRQVAIWVSATVVVGLGVHVAYPAVAGLRRSIDLLAHAELGWIAAAFGFSVLSLGCYVAVFRCVIGADAPGGRLGWRESYQVAMASQAASTLVTAAGAGGVAVMLWALVRAGFDRGSAAARIVAFLAFHYTIYLAALVVVGVLLGSGLLGPAPLALTLLPAAVAAAVMGGLVLMALSPGRFERRLAELSHRDGIRFTLARRLTIVPATLSVGLRYAAGLLRPWRRGVSIIALAVCYWATNIAILAACFHAFGESPTMARLTQAFFIGMTINLLPLLPGGVGSVEAGLIGALLAFGEPGAEVVVSVLAYRLIGFWLPTIPEAIAYLQLKRTVDDWSEEPGRSSRRSSLGATRTERGRRKVTRA